MYCAQEILSQFRSEESRNNETIILKKNKLNIILYHIFINKSQ